MSRKVDEGNCFAVNLSELRHERGGEGRTEEGRERKRGLLDIQEAVNLNSIRGSQGVQLINSLQLSDLVGLTSAAEIHLTQGHILPKVRSFWG